MTTQETIDVAETELNVDCLRVEAFGKSFQVYPWLKGRLFGKLIFGKETLQKRSFRLYMRQLAAVFYGFHNLFRKYDIWAFSSSMERRLIGGKYADKLVDFIGNECGYKTLVVELRIFKFFPRRKVASKYVISRSFFLLFELLYSGLFLRRKKVNDPELLNALFQEISGEIDHITVIRKYLAQYKMMKFWLKVFRKPKVVFVTVGYTHFGYIRAFKEADIPVYELQHGLMTKNHHAYYYNAEMNSNQFPDAILTVGEQEVKVFGSENNYPTTKIIPVGSMIIDHYRQEKSNKKRETPRILFTLQDGKMGAQLIEFILDLNKKLGDNAELVIQPRRTGKEYYYERYPALKKIAFSDKDFYSAVVNCDIHSTVYSTAAIEALSLGVPNILVNIDNQSVEQLGTVLAENPYTAIVSTAKEFSSDMKRLLEADSEMIEKSNDHLIKRGYQENIQALIKEIME